MDKEFIVPARIAAAVTLLLIALSVLFGSFYTVKSGERAVVTRFGKIESIAQPGLSLKLPFVMAVRTVDVTTQKVHSPAPAGTKDLQYVQTDVSVTFHLDSSDAALTDTATRLGVDLPWISTNIVAPRIQESVKAVAARYAAEELLTKREDVRSNIVDLLRESLHRYNITLEDVQITNFAFSDAYSKAIEDKQVAEQNAQKATNDLQRIKVEAQQKIVAAQAEAETIRIQTDAIRQQGGAAYVQLKAIDKWDGKLPNVSGGNTPFIDVRGVK